METNIVAFESTFAFEAAGITSLAAWQDSVLAGKFSQDPC